MKLSIGANIVDGPWGGGNNFAIYLSEYLKANNWQVINHLNDNDIDIILMTDPRRDLVSVKYNQLEISKYIWSKPDTAVIYRINNCDESRKTKNLNNYYVRASKVADHVVFISNYLKESFSDSTIFSDTDFSIIKNGADNKIFNPKNRKKWLKDEPLKIVSHHWSNNLNKGFDIYKKLDELSTKPLDGTRVKFTYIGNIPDNFNFRNTEIISPISSFKLSNKIKENHIYITGARGEGAGMHHIEGALCGLPLLYINSGALPEYCKDYGIMFEDTNDLRGKLKLLINNYDKYYLNMANYPNDADSMSKGYEDLFLNLLKTKENFNINDRKKKYRNIFFKEKFIYKKYNND